MIILYSIILFGLSWYSYALIDPNITFFNSPVWSRFLEQMLQLGYYHRDISVSIYITFVVLLFIVHYVFKKNYKKYNPLYIAIAVGVILLISYSFLSHDLLNYLFDAKILTFYHQNPYLHRAADFPYDPWLRFTQWIGRSYPYGPVFLAISIIPSFLSLGKFILSFLFYKLMLTAFYIWGVYMLQKQNKKWAMVFATHPLIIVEGIVNGHNDMFALSLGIIGLYYLMKKRNGIAARIIFVLSAGIKYITLPIIFLSKKGRKQNIVVLVLQLSLIIYLCLTSEVQPWYFLALFVFLPFFEDFIAKLDILFTGLLLSYYPYIYLGGWDTREKTGLKHNIVFAFLVINVIYLLVYYLKTLKKKFLIK